MSVSNSGSAAVTWAWGDTVLKATERVLLREGVPIPLGSRAFELLLQLLDRRHRVASREELIDAVWPGLVVEENNLSVQITALRKALGAGAIATVPGRGYRLTVALHADGAAPVAQVPESLAIPPTAADSRAPLGTPTLAVGKLPRPEVELLGRDDELASLARALAAQSLTTLVGAGGMGKTLLALHAAQKHLGVERDGVWWVDLAPLSPGAATDTVARALAAALGLSLTPGQSISEALCAAFKPMSALVLLDNAEHLVDAAATLLAALAPAAPGVRWLVTSQTPLKLPAEHVLSLGPLAVPPPGTPLPEALRYGALALLEQRARSANHRFELTPATLPAAIEICQRLDGIALGLEMAASRLAWLGADVLNQRLAGSLRVLAPGNRFGPSRQQTLQATLAWSHALLTATEQQVLHQLGVFVGGFTLDTAQQVARVHQDADDWAVLDALAALIDKSWVQVDGAQTPRYRLLESARQFALEQLQAAQGEQAARERHAHAMAALGDQHHRCHWNEPTQCWERSHLAEVDNLCAAFDWALNHHHAELACRIFVPLPDVLKGGSRTIELPRFAAAVQLLLPALAPPLAASVLASMAVALAPFQLPQALELGQQGLLLCRQGHGAPQLMHYILVHLSQYLSWAARSDEALQLAQEAQAMMRGNWPPRLRIQQHAAHAFTGIFGKQGAQNALDHLEQMFVLAQAHGATDAAIMARANRLAAAVRLQRHDDVIRWSTELLPQLQAPKQLATRAVTLVNLVAAYSDTGAYAQAQAVALQALPLVRRVGFRQPLLVNLVTLTLRGGRLELAAQLLGHLDAWLVEQGVQLPDDDAQSRDLALAALHEALGQPVVDRLAASGAGLSAEQADDLIAATPGPQSAF